MKKILRAIGLLLPILFMNCSENVKGKVIENVAFLTIQDHKGNDLLDPAMDSGINESTIKVYYVKDGKEIEPRAILLANNNIDYDYPDGYSCFKRDGDTINMLTLFLSDHIEYEDKSITIIKWNHLYSDTVTTKIHLLENGIIGNVELVNGKEPNWQGDSINRRRYISLIK